MEKINFQNNITPASAETMNQFQENIENAINGEEWKTLTLLNNWEITGTGFAQPRYKKIGNYVYLQGNIKGGSQGTYFGKLPEGYMPQKTLYFVVVSYGDKFAILRLDNTGDIRVNYLSGTWVDIEICFPID